MSVFVFDEDTIGIIRYILAIQRFNEYSIGPNDLTEHLCALVFERMLIQTGLKYPKFQKEKPHDISLQEVIRFLYKEKLISPNVANNLEDFLAFYSAHMFTGAKPSPEKTGETLRVLCREAGLNQEKETEGITFKEVANYRVIASASDRGMVEGDFDNLDRLYSKCPSIQMEIQKKLTTPLKAARLSGFAPNTGGIWLPFVLEDKGLMNQASVGVAFTSAGIRVGLDLGCRAHQHRIRYYELLLNGEIVDVLESLNRKATGYCLCDTFWHYHTRNIQSLQWCLTLYGSTKVTLEGAIEETKQLGDAPLTGSRYLIGKVIDRRPEDFTYIIQGLVNEMPKVLDELYPILKRIGGN